MRFRGWCRGRFDPTYLGMPTSRKSGEKWGTLISFSVICSALLDLFGLAVVLHHAILRILLVDILVGDGARGMTSASCGSGRINGARSFFCRGVINPSPALPFGALVVAFPLHAFHVVHAHYWHRKLNRRRRRQRRGASGVPDGLRVSSAKVSSHIRKCSVGRAGSQPVRGITGANRVGRDGLKRNLGCG